MSRKTGLGRGLSALIPDNQQQDSTIQTNQQSIPDSNILEIAPDDIKANQPDELTAEELENVAGGRWRGQFGIYQGCFWSLFD